MKAVLSFAPGGGALASLISDYVPSSDQRAIEAAVRHLIYKVGTLEADARIDTDKDKVNKEEFADLLKSYLRVMANTNREEKLRAAAIILADSLLPPSDPSMSIYEELDHLMHCIDTLPIGAISALGAARQVALSTGDGKRPFHFPELYRKFPIGNPDLLMSLVSPLRALNLISVQEGTIKFPDYSEALVHLTPIGLRFAERFIEGRM